MRFSLPFEFDSIWFLDLIAFNGIANAAAIDSNKKFIYANAESGAIALLDASEFIYIFIQNNIVIFQISYLRPLAILPIAILASSEFD